MTTYTATQIDHTTHYAALRIRYPFIAAYCQMLGSHAYYVRDELDRAAQDDAPTTATASKHNHDPSAPRQWYTLEDHGQTMRNRLIVSAARTLTPRV